MSVSIGDRCVACGKLIHAGDITHWHGDAKQPMHQHCSDEAQQEHFAFADAPVIEKPTSSRVVYRTDHLPQPCRQCRESFGLGWLHTNCMERYFRILRFTELNARRVK